MPIWSQKAINELLVERVKQGQRVVRLKGGDPAVFARTAEELDELERHKLDFEVVPGVTAALAAASYTGIPLTHRDHSSAVAFVTGKQQAGSDPEQFDWPGLAAFPGTLVFYMGVTTAKWWTGQLMSAGKPGDTPAAIIRRSTWRDQKVVRCRLDEVADLLTPASKMRPPVLVVVGKVAALGESWDWFSQRPLLGLGVLITRPEKSIPGRPSELTILLEELGAETFHQPFLQPQLSSVDKLSPVLDQLASGHFDGVTFSSKTGARGLLEAAHARGLDARIFANCKLAAVGPTTSSELLMYGLRADIIPRQEFSAATLAEELETIAAGKNWLVTTTDASSDTLPSCLRRFGATVTTCVTYEMMPAQEISADVVAALEAGSIQYVTATSPRLAREAHRLLSSHRGQVQPIALSGAIAEQLEQLSWPAAAVAQEATMASFADAAVRAASSRNTDC
ncbi:MAG: uroporphyrinogen-III C-methyltransferase [Aureliella sp.]